MSRVVFVTQLIDPDDPVLGTTVHQIRALARHVEELVVVANEVRGAPADLGVEVRSLGKERGRPRWRRTASYLAIVGRLAAQMRPVTLLAHMCPTYLNLASPLVALAGGRCLLWFAHPSDTPTLRRAERRAHRVLTAFPGSYPRPGPKVEPIGQTIDVARFNGTPPPAGPSRLVALGRTSAVKDYPTAIEAVARARSRGTDIRLTIVGPSITDAEKLHRQRLVELVDELGLVDVVELAPGVAPHQVPQLLATATALVNTTATGSSDKAVLEALAARRPALACSASFKDLLDGVSPMLWFPPGDADALADRMVALAALGPAERQRLGEALRRIVESHHSVEHWAAEVARVADEVHQPAQR